MNKVKFSYQRFCEYVMNKMSAIYEQDGKHEIVIDTQPLEEFRKSTEEETLKYIYDNKMFDELNEVIIQATIPYKYREVYEKLNSLSSNLDDALKKGDIIKTALSDNTIVLKVEADNALLFSGRQFVVAHGIQKEDDYVSWGHGDYYNELDDVYIELEEEKELEDEWDMEM